ncbi:transposase family protein [Brevibacterium sp. FME17]|uniref:transposase family protein n=1 Tax=Brevibacterium sp. FME17 TaxID=2742606 RepID=UPI0018679010|nr:transposase family protein [Brevibacterium sp. FME17]
MPYHSTCGLSPAQIAELIDRVHEVHTTHPDQERYDFEMPLDQAVVMVLIMVRHNLAQQITADLFGVSQPTVSRVYRYLMPVLGMVTMMDRTRLADALASGVVLIDGTPIPTGNRTATGKENFNGKHRKQALNVQVAAWPDGTLADVSDPVPGRRHDLVALDLVGWGYQIRAASDENPQLAVFGDSAYGRHTDWTPLKKVKDVERTAEDIAFNRAISSFRAPVERTIGLLKQWKTLATGYRESLAELPTVIHVIVNLECYRLAG